MYDEFEISLPSRNDINAKYLFNNNTNYKLSRNNLIVEYRKYRTKMSGLVDILDKLYVYTKVKRKELTPLQSRCTKAISEEWANSNIENRFDTYKNCINIMSNFLYSTGSLANEPLATNELKILKMMASYMFFKASECIDELNKK